MDLLLNPFSSPAINIIGWTLNIACLLLITRNTDQPLTSADGSPISKWEAVVALTILCILPGALAAFVAISLVEREVR